MAQISAKMVLAGIGATTAGALVALLLTAQTQPEMEPNTAPVFELAQLTTFIPSAAEAADQPVTPVQAPVSAPGQASPFKAAPAPEAAAPTAAAPEAAVPASNDAPTRVGVLGTGATVTIAGDDLTVDAPQAKVKVDHEADEVRVQAPYTDVKVDPANGRVRVRAPYVNLNVHW